MRVAFHSLHPATRSAAGAIGLLLLGILPLMACGGGGGPDGPTTPSTPTPAPAPAPTTDNTSRVLGVTITPATLSLYVGDQATLTATVSVANGASTTVTWTSREAGVAGVSAAGIVSAAAEGTTSIRATATADSTKFFDVPVSVLAVPYDPGYPRTMPPGGGR